MIPIFKSLRKGARRSAVSAIRSRRESVDPELKLPETASLVIMIVANILLQLSFFIIVSSSNKYAEYLGGTSTFSGIVIGIPTVASGIVLIPMTRYDKGGYKMPLHVACGFSIIGHILYATAYQAHFLYLILIGRIVGGVAFSGFMYCKRYCTDPRIVGVRRRTTLASWLVIGQGLGMTLGPFAGGLLYKIGFANSVFNGFTSPGWVMAGVWAVFWVCVTVWYKDVPTESDDVELRSVGDPTPSPQLEKAAGNDNLPVLASSSALEEPEVVPATPVAPVDEALNQNLSSQIYRVTSAQWGVIVCMCWFAMANFFILGSWEANLPVLGASMPQLNWSPYAAGNFIALGGITTFPFLLANLLLSQRLQDRKLLAFGSAVGLTGLLIALSLLRTSKVNYGSLFACWWLVALGFNLATTVTLSLLSKQLPPEWNGRTSMAIQYSNYTGRVTGAVWGGSGVRVGMLNFVGVEIAIVGIGAVLFIALWRDLKAKMG
ncbi:hypothetical protein SERLA73DRAFT_174378 [Serpula lacrymans var. lacrymans S7.3]|uniref:Major facilitator superfamily (MFS) profile domain-containing protein n=2 Tax=Serpula lacrymans var. lacrymans TaxID=341189 RepID=F8PFK7_SERL3|nr:uncharacterized protein SERLADRAFT_412587 [Serpula lacrymans var. lacrymans S7.9]EGO05296.1 hypothetical protein SERLA73DRAFT_174378 [Serpula lacrymans var. lacrymans S7.3]EGO31153.1 hypothetical protein SERLADRAFT_412587 [Serpula lacrymans var. lacrymans S7.9]